MGKAYRPAWDKNAGLAANARRELPRISAAYFAEVRRHLAGDPPLSNFHLARLATKRFRYTLEFFRGCYGPGLEEKLGVLARAQQILGDLNDAVVTAKLVPVSTRAHAHLRRRAEAKAREFREYWDGTLDAANQERRWLRYLSRPLPGR